ncbi:hypothetical protein RJ640_003795 [Escallonia rubra]|uniref:Uncharacterized protein n=1 Tax=Escallonia rubra TaxID=112253 RepID=A0AA88RK72_9ASTE|nr:hypothetical protein RJ640_003795 [Escallonia rubra]
MREYFVRRSDGCEDPNLHMGRKAFITALLLGVTSPAGNRTRLLAGAMASSVASLAVAKPPDNSGKF